MSRSPPLFWRAARSSRRKRAPVVLLPPFKHDALTHIPPPTRTTTTTAPPRLDKRKNKTKKLTKKRSRDGLTRGECGVSWDDFCEDPWGAADVLHRRDCLARSKSYTYFHMVDQWHCMRTAEGGSAVDFVGSVETGDEDWAAIVAAINARRRGAGDGDTAPPPPLPASRLGVSNVRKGQVAGPYNGAHSHCLDAVSRWYACDAEKFGYLPRMATDGPPDAL